MFLKLSSPFTDESRIESEGQKDGEQNIPDMESYQPAQFEQALVSHGEQDIERVYRKASLRVAKLQPIYQACERRLHDLETRLRAVGKRYADRKNELDRDFSTRFPHKYHVALIIFLGVGEFPLNTIVFRLFGEPEFLTYVMASTLAITIPLLGLFIGVHVRQSVPEAAGNIMVGLMIPSVAGAALYAISSLRNTYIVSQASLTPETLPAGQDELAYALFALNALVFCGAMVSAFFAHDCDEKLDSYHGDLVVLDRRAIAVRKKLFRTGTQLNAEIQRAKSRIGQVRALCNQRIALYRRTNIRFRSLLPPPCFRKDPEFRELDWWPEIQLDFGSRTAG
jgi:hypothetical protein